MTIREQYKMACRLVRLLGHEQSRESIVYTALSFGVPKSISRAALEATGWAGFYREHYAWCLGKKDNRLSRFMRWQFDQRERAA